MTESLIERCERLIAIELDPRFAIPLAERFARDTRIQVVESDVLAVDLAQWGRATVCGNLPYYITSPIIEKVLSLGPSLERAVFLVQKEVADRLAAGPGSRDYGYLSVATQLQAEVERLFVVKPASFRPPPKVDSAVVRLTPRKEPLVDDKRAFLKFASACFRQKRKTLRNNLSALYGGAASSLPQRDKRAEQLSIQELIEIHRSV